MYQIYYTDQMSRVRLCRVSHLLKGGCYRTADEMILIPHSAFWSVGS